jgi:hypothetical protein
MLDIGTNCWPGPGPGPAHSNSMPCSTSQMHSPHPAPGAADTQCTHRRPCPRQPRSRPRGQGLTRHCTPCSGAGVRAGGAPDLRPHSRQPGRCHGAGRYLWHGGVRCRRLRRAAAGRCCRRPAETLQRQVARGRHRLRHLPGGASRLIGAAGSDTTYSTAWLVAPAGLGLTPPGLPWACLLTPMYNMTA